MIEARPREIESLTVLVEALGYSVAAQSEQDVT